MNPTIGGNDMENLESPRPGWRARLRERVSPKALTAAGMIAVGTVAFVSGGVFFTHPHVLASPSALAKTAEMAAPSPKLLSESHQFSFADLVERVSPAVVSIRVDMQARVQNSAMPQIPAPFRDLFRDFGFEDQQGPQGKGAPGPQGRRGMPAPQGPRAQAAGSGFIIESNGYIITNNHVVDDARKITVKLNDGREFEAKLVGADKDTDIALLKVEANGLPTVALGDDRRLRVGDWVVAVGNPFNLGGTVTAGIVSSIGRDIGNGPYTDYLQIDAPINHGNSGGPTFDISGRVVGMNTAIFSPSGGSVGIGFAVPASTSKAVADELKTSGSINRGWLGVQIQNFTPELASSVGMKDQKGAMVASVVDGSPAARAGFEQGDVVIALNGTEVTDSKVLTRQVASIHAGDKATFTVMRNGARHTLTATIEKRDADRMASAEQGPAAQQGSLGLSLSPMNPALRQQYELGNTVNGVVVSGVDPDSEAARKGVTAGDVIKRVGQHDVKMPSDVARAVDDARKAGRDSVLMLLANEHGDRFVALRLSQG
jgi:serine protease Do